MLFWNTVAMERSFTSWAVQEELFVPLAPPKQVPSHMLVLMNPIQIKHVIYRLLVCSYGFTMSFHCKYLPISVWYGEIKHNHIVLLDPGLRRALLWLDRWKLCVRGGSGYSQTQQRVWVLFWIGYHGDQQDGRQPPKVHRQPHLPGWPSACLCRPSAHLRSCPLIYPYEMNLPPNEKPKTHTGTWRLLAWNPHWISS